MGKPISVGDIHPHIGQAVGHLTGVLIGVKGVSLVAAAGESVLLVRTFLGTAPRIETLVLRLASCLVHQLFAEGTRAEGAVRTVVALEGAACSVGRAQISRTSPALVCSSGAMFFSITQLSDRDTGIRGQFTGDMFEGTLPRVCSLLPAARCFRLVAAISTVVLAVTQPRLKGHIRNINESNTYAEYTAAIGTTELIVLAAVGGAAEFWLVRTIVAVLKSN